MDGDVMARERDHLKPHVRVRVAQRAQLRIPCDEPQRAKEIIKALQVLIHGLTATTQMDDLNARSVAMYAMVQEAEKEMQRIARGRWQEPLPKDRW